MKEKTLKLITHPLFSGSAMMVIGSNLINAMNYIYHFAMGRLLGITAYGELVTLFSLISILSMVPMAFSMVITKFVSSTSSKESIKGLLFIFYKYIAYLIIVLSILLLFLIPTFASFLHIDNLLLVFAAVLVFIISLPVMINRSALQGLLRFGAVLITLFTENILKLSLGVLLVIIGFNVGGALAGVITASVISFLVSIYFLRDYRPTKRFKPESLKPIIFYSIPVFVNFIAVTLFSNTDLLLVKHYFSPTETGSYAAAAVLSKVILFGVSPIVNVMFPIVAKRYAEGSSYRSIFLLTVGVVSSFCFMAILGYTFLAGLVIWTLYGTKFLTASSLLSLFSIYISFFSISTVFTNYFLAIGKTHAVYFSLFAALLQIVGIIHFHESLEQVLIVSIVVSALLLGMLIVYSVYENQSKRHNTPIGYRSGVQTAKNNRKRS